MNQKKYTRKQIQESINFWTKKLNETEAVEKDSSIVHGWTLGKKLEDGKIMFWNRFNPYVPDWTEFPYTIVDEPYETEKVNYVLFGKNPSNHILICFEVETSVDAIQKAMSDQKVDLSSFKILKEI